MAKKKQSKTAQGKNKAKKAESKQAAKVVAPEVTAAEAAYRSGDFSALRKLALASGDLPADARGRIEELHEMTRTDPQAWMVAFAALIIAVIVAVATLGV